MKMLVILCFGFSFSFSLAFTSMAEEVSVVKPVELNVAVIVLVGTDVYLKEGFFLGSRDIKKYDAASWDIEGYVRNKYIDNINSLSDPEKVKYYKASTVALSLDEKRMILTAYYNEDVYEKDRIHEETVENEEDRIIIDWAAVNKEDAIIFSNLIGKKYDRLILVVKNNKYSPGYGITYSRTDAEAIFRMKASISVSFYNLRDPKLIVSHTCCFGQKLSLRPKVTGETITAHHSIETFKDVGALDMAYIRSTLEYILSNDISRYITSIMFFKPPIDTEEEEDESD